MNKLSLFLLVLLLIPAVTAIGIFPSKVCFEKNGEDYNLLDMFCDKAVSEFQSGQAYTGQACAIGKDYYASIQVQGEFESAVSISKGDLFLPSGQSVCVPYTFILPENITEPGLHETLISVMEKETTDSGPFPIITGAAQQLQIIVPYPDLYLKAELKASSVNVSMPVKLDLTLTSFGKLDTAASGEITISLNNKQVASLDIVQTEVVAGASESQTLNWTTKKAGNYTAEAKIKYGEKTVKSAATFEVLAKPWTNKLSPRAYGLSAIILIIAAMLIVIIGGYCFLKKYEK